MNNRILALTAVFFSSFSTAATWSPDGKTIAYSYIANPENIYLVDADGNNPRTLVARAQRDFRPEWSPDGQHLIFTSVIDEKHVTYTVDLTGKLKQLTAVDEVVGGAQYSADGDEILYFTDQPLARDIYIRNLTTKQQQNLTQSQDFDEYSARWTADNHHIVYVKKSHDSDDLGDLWMMNRATGETKNITNTPNQDEFHPAWSHDGNKVVFIQVKAGVFNVVWLDVETGTQHRLASGNGYAVLSPHFSPDDRWVSFTRTDFAEQADNLPAIVKVSLETGCEELITRWQ